VRRRRPIPVISSANPTSASQETSKPVLGRPPAAVRLEDEETPEEPDPEVEEALRPDEPRWAGGPGVSEDAPEPEPEEPEPEEPEEPESAERVPELECRTGER